MSIATIIAASEAGAKAAEVSGGMSIVSPEFMTALLSGISAIVSAALVYWRMKGKSEEVKMKRPLDHDDVYVTNGQCKQYRCALEKRIDEVGPALNRLFMKLCENDRKSEERTIRLHQRLEPVIEKVAANCATLEMMKLEKKQKKDGDDEKQNA